MTHATRRIKNLSIALEAISRINGTRSEYDRIRNALAEEIDRFEEEQEKKVHKRARTAQPTVAEEPL